MTEETLRECIWVTSDKGFVYEVIIEHKPHFGFSTALYRDSIIGQVELGRILQPIGDNDREWDMYEERLSEWKDEIKTNIVPTCKKYFNDRRNTTRTTNRGKT